jgi:hypothetical protein
MPDQIDAVEADLFEPRTDDARVPFERVTCVGLFQESVASNVQHHGECKMSTQRAGSHKAKFGL